jgi:hypothetical protein
MRTAFYCSAFLGFFVYLVATTHLSLLNLIGCLMAATARTVLLGVVLTPLELLVQAVRNRINGS